ncbi:putative reverse transcriptase domain-containing protein [Tanacetum coccineum]
MVPRAVLMKSGLVSINIARQNISKTAVLVNTARQVNAAHSKTTVNVARPMSYLSKIAHSTVKRPIHKNTSFKNSNINQRVNTVRGNNFNTARPKAVVNAVKGNNFNVVKASACWGNPQMDLQDQGLIDNGCSRYMTGNMSYLTNYEEIDGGYVAFGENPKGGKITGKCTIKTEAVNTACYVQNRVLVVKPHNKTSYEYFHGRTPTLSFMRPFGYPITILNTIDHLGKFDGKADEGFFIGYSLNSKTFKVFNSRTRIVEENLHIRFSESTPNVVGTKASDNACQAIEETKSVKDYILLPLWTADLPFSQDSKSSHDNGPKPSSDDGKKVDEDPRKDSESINAVGGKTSIKLPDDLNMFALEDYNIFNSTSDDQDDGAEADMDNLDTTIQVSPIPTTRIHKDHPLNQVIGDLQLATQIRNMSKNLEEYGFEELLQFKLQEVWTLVELPNRKRAICTKWVFRNKKDERGIVIRNKAIFVAQGYTQEEGFDSDEVFAPVARIEAIRLFLAYASFKDFAVYQMDVKIAFLYGKIEEEVYVCQPLGFEDPDFPDRVYKVKKVLYVLHQAPRACQDKYVGEILKKFGFTEVKTASTPMETQKPLLKDEYGEEMDVHMYRSMIGSLMYLTSLRPDIMFAVCACARYQVNPKVSHIHAVKRIFRYLKGQPKLGLWYPKDSPFDLVAYTDSDYAIASLDMKSTTEGCQFLGCRLISWQCKKQIVVANSTIEAEYMAASCCCRQVL